MKNFFKVLLVGLFTIGLSSVAGATEWKTVELPKGTMVKIEIPNEMVALETERGMGTEFSSIFANDKDRIGVIVKKDSAFQDMAVLKDLSGEYPFDEITKDKEQEILKDTSKGGEKYQWIALPSGHKALAGEEVNGNMRMKVMFVMKGKYSIGVAIIKDGEFSAEEIKMAEEVFNRLKF